MLTSTSVDYLLSTDFRLAFCHQCEQKVYEDDVGLFDCPCGLDPNSDNCIRHNKYAEITQLLEQAESLWCVDCETD